MITFLFAFAGSMIGGIVINYILNANNPNWEEPINYEPKD
jgi:hypothetical protein